MAAPEKVQRSRPKAPEAEEARRPRKLTAAKRKDLLEIGKRVAKRHHKTLAALAK